MHNVHFIKVNAENCKDAINLVNGEIYLENSHADYFLIIGAFNIDNPNDFLKVNESNHWEFESILGDNPAEFISKVYEYLNDDYKPVTQLKIELLQLINNLNDKNINTFLPWEIHFKAKELIGCKYINDLLTQNKYEYDWPEIGLTDCRSLDNE